MIFLSTLIDTRALIYVIFENLVRKFKLKIETNNGIKVVPLEGKSKIKVIDLIFNASIIIQNLYMLESLYVIGGTESVVILEWINIRQT